MGSNRASYDRLSYNIEFARGMLLVIASMEPLALACSLKHDPYLEMSGMRVYTLDSDI